MRDLVTVRLRLEPWQLSHGELLERLSALPEVMRYIGDGTPWTADDARGHSERAFAHWREHGFGWRRAVERDGGRPVGMVALELTRDVPGLDDGEHEIGWWLDPAVWGRGYATEAGRAIVAEAFGRVQAPSVVARIQPGNAASLAVARALGLTYERDAVGRRSEPVRILRLEATAASIRPRCG